MLQFLSPLNLKNFLDENRSLQILNAKPKSNVLLSGSILSAAIFVGSTIMHSTNEVLGITGMIGSLAIMGIFVIFRKDECYSIVISFPCF